MVVVALGSTAAAEPCISVTSANADDVAAIRRVLVDAFPETPGACIDASVESVVLDDSHAEIALTASLRVVVSSARGQLHAVLAGGATLHVARSSYRTRRAATYRRDVLEQATTGLVPALRAHVTARTTPSS